MDNLDTSPASLSGQAFIYNSVYASSLIILYYDYLLTFPEELARYWIGRRKASLAWFLFSLNRYFALLGHIPILIKLFWRSSDSRHIQVNVSLGVLLDEHQCYSHIVRCAQLVEVHEYIITIGQVIIGICLLLRTYALYGRTRLALTIICMTAAAESVYVVWKTATEKPSSTSVTLSTHEGCLVPFSFQASTQLRSLWINQLCFDVLIFAFTLYKTLQAFRGGTSNILSIMLRDGTIYFGVMIIMAVVGIIDLSHFPLYIRGVTATMGNVLASTMVSRLMLNLRDPKFGPTGGSQVQSMTQVEFGNKNLVNTSTSDWI
ncbi:hypothetical protein GALMADRAFT_145351 [Galerina marginata CBS 339.88]|uniref:DUF6533 domain-containing protein n=1 Tax=Galerina marginata (strain CBS 339.88) TaxID=685588 RepID=A0A067SS74_GALM3|nr:hypothetical protein GALMADRAFT_145351 [Galerina marginata CBS 339.88]